MWKKIIPALFIAALSIAFFANAEKADKTARIADGLSVATFAGGCFWCTESDFEKVPGVKEVLSGYTDGHVKNPTYKQVSSGGSGHIESVKVFYDADVISYKGLLEAFWRQINPTDAGGQFVDRGHQYSSAIFYHTPEQKMQAETSLKALQATGRYKKPLATPILPAKIFYNAEEYHQDYYKKNPLRYKFYRYNSGRDQYLEKTWGEEIHVDYTHYSKNGKKYQRPSDAELRKTLTPLQYDVTQKDGTERPFDNPYWDEKRDGIYVEITTGEPLFSSKDKYKSGTGWPSFTQAINSDAVDENTDYKLILPRTEIRSKIGDAHLGHVFDDGPAPTGKRYCMNSASMRFIPQEDLVKEGYAELANLFETE
ncbi:MAG: peptide-methionine (R)-S-oxide reductase MsrB [Gammaproteobacteria bacterium]|nr:peptide-methionine (R)-S-oxide reductase MsrB [Gammaproteobacteria bacterium]